MIPVSEGYRAAVRAGVRTDRLRGRLTLADGAVVEFSDADVMSGSVTLDDACVTGQELQYGAAYLGQAALQLKTELNRYRLYGAKLAMWYGLLLADGSWEEVPLGVYTVAEAERTSVYVAITAYDNLLALDKRMGAAALRGDAATILGAIAESCGLELAQSGEELAALCNAGGDYQLSAADGCNSYRDALGALAQVLGCFGTVDGQGRLCLRRFAAQPCLELGPGQRQSAAVADYCCHYAMLEVETEAGHFAAQEEDGSGLTMTLTDAPLFGAGLPSTLQGMTDALFAELNAADYTPATVQMPGDPAICCGDRLRLTEVGERGDTVEMLVMSRVWRFRKGQTVKAMGSNPYLAGAKSRDEAVIRRLQSETSANKLIFYSFQNPKAIRVNSAVQETPVGSLNFVSVSDTSALFVAQVLVTAKPDDVTLRLTAADGSVLTAVQPGRVLLRVKYTLNNTPVTDFCPQQTLEAGAHTLALVYPFASVAAATNNHFTVSMLAEGGSVEIAAGAARATVTGQGMAGGKVWDGTIRLQEMLPRLALASGAVTLRAMRMTSSPLKVQIPQGVPLAGRLARLEVSSGGVVLSRLRTTVTDRVLETGYTITTTMNRPNYEERYLMTEDKRFALRRKYRYESEEYPVEEGALSGVTLRTSDLAEVSGMEVL